MPICHLFIFKSYIDSDKWALDVLKNLPFSIRTLKKTNTASRFGPAQNSGECFARADFGVDPKNYCTI